MEKSSKIKVTIFLTLITAVGAVIIQQFFFKGNKDHLFRNEILEKNYEYYRSAQNFSDLGFSADVTLFPGPPDSFFVITYENGDIDTLRMSSLVIGKFKLPRIAVDSIYQIQWRKEKEFIEENKNKIDQKVFSRFLKVVTIMRNNPWPSNITLKELESSIWTDEKFIQKWRLENERLASEVDRLIGF